MNYSAAAARQPRLLLILASLFLALTFEFLPWPGWLVKPLFAGMVLVYWTVHRPQIINYTAAVLLGVIMDLAARQPLGFTALSYTAMVTLVNIMRWRFSLLGAFGKAGHVFLILACGQFILFLLDLLDSGLWAHLSWSYFAPSAATAALWLLMPLLLDAAGRILEGRKDE